MDFSTFFATGAASAATLMGLLFVALQFNLERRRSDLRWVPVARATFNMFTLLFVVSVIELIPSSDAYQSSQLLFLIAPAGAIYRQVRIWYATREFFGKDRLFHTVWLMLIPVAVFGLMILYAVAPPGALSQAKDIQTPEAVLCASMFLTALRNSWDLVLEAGLVKSEEPKNAQPPNQP